MELLRPDRWLRYPVTNCTSVASAYPQQQAYRADAQAAAHAAQAPWKSLPGPNRTAFAEHPHQLGTGLDRKAINATASAKACPHSADKVPPSARLYLTDQRAAGPTDTDRLGNAVRVRAPSWVDQAAVQEGWALTERLQATSAASAASLMKEVLMH